MLTKQQLTFLKSLHQKKFRQMYGKFLVEGDKLVRELLTSSFKVDAIYALPGWQGATERQKIEKITISADELSKISTHENPNQVVAVAEIRAQEHMIPQQGLSGLIVCCDNLNDPGNAGTIIRTADWFGIEYVFFSPNSVDVYNPKTVSAAKGSLFRVKCVYTNLAELFKKHTNMSVYGTFMDGEYIYSLKPAKDAFVLIGNEANGIGNELLPYIGQKIAIPNYGKAESLNAAVAAGIIMSEFKRQS